MPRRRPVEIVFQGPRGWITTLTNMRGCPIPRVGETVRMIANRDLVVTNVEHEYGIGPNAIVKITIHCNNKDT